MRAGLKGRRDQSISDDKNVSPFCYLDVRSDGPGHEHRWAEITGPREVLGTAALGSRNPIDVLAIAPVAVGISWILLAICVLRGTHYQQP